MSKATGFLFILAGIGTAAYILPASDIADRKAEKQLADVVSIATAAKPSPAPIAVDARVQPQVVRAAPVAALVAPPERGANVAVASAHAKSVAADVVARPIEPSQPARKTGAGKAEDDARLALTRDIQRELKRVGCYSGEVTGDWTAGTRQAMKTFIDRVNATLPIDEPDHILKTLVKGHPGNACGSTCPAGQGMNGDGRCVPSAILAQPAKTPVPTVREAAVRPKPVTPRAVSSGWEARVIAAPAAPVAPVAEGPRFAEAPAGRMAIGGPIAKHEAQRTDIGKSAAAAPPAAVVLRPAPQRPAPERGSNSREIVSAPANSVVGAEGPGSGMPPAVGAISAAQAGAATQRLAALPDAADGGAGAGQPIAAPAPRPQARPARVEGDFAERRAPVVVYRAPPPRYVGVYNSAPSPAARERSKFGPQIFERLARDAR